MTDKYEEVSKASVYDVDLKSMIDTLEALGKIEDSNDTFIFEGEVTIARNHYIVGKAWWDVEAEAWRADFRRNGESV